MTKNQHEAKSINSELPKPIAFNCWKHHLGFVKNILNKQSINSKDNAFINELIQFIGESQLDFYTGNLDVYSISDEIIKHLKSLNALDFTDYQAWIYTEGYDYKCISISDGSNWTLRLGQNNNRYIHIHPSRHSKKTIRIKSSTLKTAFALLFYYGLSNADISIEKVNHVRNRFAKLPQLKPTSALIATSRIFKLLIV